MRATRTLLTLRTSYIVCINATSSLTDSLTTRLWMATRLALDPMSPIVNLAQLAAWSKLLVTCPSLTPPPPGWRARVCPGRATLRCVCLYTPGPRRRKYGT